MEYPMRIPFMLVGMMLVSSCSLLARENDDAQTKEHRDGYKQGVGEAEQELKEGHPTLYAFGLRMSVENVDRKTGLPFTFIAGCEVDDRILGREQGHDARIREHIKVHGLPASSFKKWEKELFDLKGFYNVQTKTAKSAPLAVGGPMHVSPDGKYTVAPIQMSFEKDDGTISPILGIAVAAQGKKPAHEKILWAEDETDFLWGPAGSRFIVIRCRDKSADHYMAYDLERANWLRWEAHWKDRK
jgi:hypothetical protein